MSDKYPSMSPYSYCANNPVILVDPDGRDYETVINEKAGTITIVAKYYTTKKNKDRVQKAVDVWNGQSGKYEMVMVEGENQKWGNCNGTNIYVKSDASTREDVHEIGQILGIGESVMGLMVSNQRSPLSSHVIDQTDIGSIFYRAGYKNDTITEIYYGAKNHVKPTQNVRLQLKENLIK
jgi:hypothetical protein